MGRSTWITKPQTPRYCINLWCNDVLKAMDVKEGSCRGQKRRAYSTSTSRVVPHRSTMKAATSLSSRFGWDVEYSGSYGRRQRLTPRPTISTLLPTLLPLPPHVHPTNLFVYSSIWICYNYPKYLPLLTYMHDRSMWLSILTFRYLTNGP